MPLWTMDPFNSDCESTLTLQEMIDCDIQADFDGVLGSSHYSCPVQTLDVDSPSGGTSFHLDSDLPSDSMGNLTWLRQENLCSYVDLETTGLLVNPQTGLPIHSNNSHLYARPKLSPQQQQVASPDLEACSPSPTDTAPTPMSEVGLPAIKAVAGTNHKIVTPVTSSVAMETGGHHRKEYPKPTYSYSCLIAMALRNSETGSLPVSEIYSFMTENFPYFKTAPNGWKNSVRHNLSLNKCFEKVEKPSATNTSQRKGCLWALNPAKINKLDEEVQKWSRKDPALIRRSMSRPENFEHFEKGLILHRQSKTEVPLRPAPSVSMPSDAATVKIKREPGEAELDAMGATIALDTSLPDLNLQSGIWDELDEQLQFGVSVANDEPATVSVTLTATSVRPMYRLSDASAPIVG